MTFSIITPSLGQLPWLKRCVRSVADQGVEAEHLIQDAGSGPALEQWVRGQPGAQLFVEADAGMYDAINRGLDRARGEFCAYLNCDEQYLPGTLARVERAFREHPQADLVAGDFLMTDPAGALLAFRKATPLHAAMIRTDHLYAYTCALFFRRRIFEQGLRFDASLKVVADGEWVASALEKGHRAVLVDGFLSAFTFTGENLGESALARTERDRLRAALPLSLRLAAPLLRQWRHVEKLRAGAYRRRPIDYAVYVGEEDGARTALRCERPGWRYPGL